MRRGGGWCPEAVERSKVPPGSAEMLQRLPRGRGADTGQQLQDTECRDGVTGVLDPAKNAKHILDVRRFEELQSAVFDEGDTPGGEFDLKLIAVLAGTEQHRLPFQVHAALARLEAAPD